MVDERRPFTQAAQPPDGAGDDSLHAAHHTPILVQATLPCPGSLASKIVEVYPSRLVLYGEHVRIERHWWNGNRSPGGRRDVFIRTDGQKWEVEAQSGGTAGRSRVQQCPGPTSAEILASAWRGGRPGWRELAP